MQLWRNKKMKEINEGVFTLIKDHATIKEAFIVDELQSYMDLKDPSNPKWVTPVRVRLQKKKDWEQKIKDYFNKFDKHDTLMVGGIIEDLGIDVE